MKRALAALLTALPLAAAVAQPAAPPEAPPPGDAAPAAGEAGADAAGDEVPPASGHPADPFERWNRAVYTFNDRIDRAVLRPVARGYVRVVPEPVRRGIGNFFGNLDDAWSAVNHFLQGKPASGLQMTMRVATNSVFGLAGVLDVASEAGLERAEEDFGQTLGRWGLGSGPYLVLPLLGPSSVRDTAGLPVDFAASPTSHFGNDTERAGMFGLRLVDGRARLLDATRMLEELAFDPYTFTRDAYLARRRSLVWDGNPPDTGDDGYEDDGYDDGYEDDQDGGNHGDDAGRGGDKGPGDKRPGIEGADDGGRNHGRNHDHRDHDQRNDDRNEPS